MRLFNQTVRLQFGRGLLLSGALTFTTGLSAAQPQDDQQDLARLQADCRIEGEAGGLSGTDLQQFVDQCVADLLSVELSNAEE